MSVASVLRLELKASRLLAGALVLAHVMALAATWLSLAGWARYGSWAVILASLWRVTASWRSAALSLELHEDGRASWRNRDGAWHEGRLGRNHFTSTALAVVGLEAASERTKWVVVMPDSLASEDFRRLRVWLRWRPGPSQNNLTGD